ncbi:high mobility group protein, putative [Babesia ovis]|uniref:High mobility group protein, putative n=1 Tax=Babesia ovis TaxID=5869 RepID=A0A9W5WWD0_BABOV|nr:high mobility group protein, putative [Babesia ovis]
MSVASPPVTTTGFRLFYEEVVSGVRAELRERLGTETVPLADVQREVSRLWKECPRQEEYRQKAALLRQSQPATELPKTATTDDLTIPPHRLRRIIDLDDEAPRVSKDALKVLGKATVCLYTTRSIIRQTIFLSQLAGNIHKHIVDTDSNYPAKPEHVWNVVKSPLHLKYEFLACSEKQLGCSTGTHGSRDTPTLSTSGSTTVERGPNRVSSGVALPTQGVESTPQVESVARTPEIAEPAKKRSASILSYFSSNKSS